jgi:hypothetical protein
MHGKSSTVEPSLFGKFILRNPNTRFKKVRDSLYRNLLTTLQQESLFKF